MPLIQKVLSANILSALKKQMEDKGGSASPNVSQAAADSLASAYHDWIFAGFPTAPFTFVNLPVSNVLSTQIVLPEFSGWGAGLTSYWASTTVTGPGFIPVNPLSPPSLATLPVLAQKVSADMKLIGNASSKNSNESIEAVADKLSVVLFTFTVSLSFLTTTASAVPVTAVLPVI